LEVARHRDVGRPGEGTETVPLVKFTCVVAATSGMLTSSPVVGRTLGLSGTHQLTGAVSGAGTVGHGDRRAPERYHRDSPAGCGCAVRLGGRQGGRSSRDTDDEILDRARLAGATAVVP